MTTTVSNMLDAIAQLGSDYDAYAHTNPRTGKKHLVLARQHQPRSQWLLKRAGWLGERLEPVPADMPVSEADLLVMESFICLPSQFGVEYETAILAIATDSENIEQEMLTAFKAMIQRLRPAGHDREIPDEINQALWQNDVLTTQPALQQGVLEAFRESANEAGQIDAGTWPMANTVTARAREAFASHLGNFDPLNKSRVERAFTDGRIQDDPELLDEHALSLPGCGYFGETFPDGQADNRMLAMAANEIVKLIARKTPSVDLADTLSTVLDDEADRRLLLRDSQNVMDVFGQGSPYRDEGYFNLIPGAANRPRDSSSLEFRSFAGVAGLVPCESAQSFMRAINLSSDEVLGYLEKKGDPFLDDWKTVSVEKREPGEQPAISIEEFEDVIGMADPADGGRLHATFSMRAGLKDILAGEFVSGQPLRIESPGQLVLFDFRSGRGWSMDMNDDAERAIELPAHPGDWHVDGYFYAGARSISETFCFVKDCLKSGEFTWKNPEAHRQPRMDAMADILRHLKSQGLIHVTEGTAYINAQATRLAAQERRTALMSKPEEEPRAYAAAISLGLHLFNDNDPLDMAMERLEDRQGAPEFTLIELARDTLTPETAVEVDASISP